MWRTRRGRPLLFARMRSITTAVTAAALLALSACADGDDDAAATTTAAPTTVPAASTTSTSTTTTSTTLAPGSPSDPALRDELLTMLEQDQAVRTGIAPPGDTRTEEELFDDAGEVDWANKTRLTEILDEHGWPGWSLVGKDGSTAAWAIVQHADLDLPFQERGLELLQAAVDAGDASKGDLAYLTDRVLVAKGLPQVYGTQWSPNEAGEWLPRTPIEDEANVDARRADAGLGTIAEYMVELNAMFGDVSETTTT
jgi:hypothetical protein